MTARINCPLCEWFHDDPGPNPLSADPMALASVFGPGVFAAHALNEHARKIEEMLAAHFKTHTTVEWLRKVTALQAEVERLKGERELDANYFRDMKAERDTLRAEVAALEKQVRLAAGMLSTHPQFADQHPEVALRFIQDAQVKDDARECACFPLSVRGGDCWPRMPGEPGNLEVYCAKCGKVFRAADKPRFTDGHGNSLDHLLDEKP